MPGTVQVKGKTYPVLVSDISSGGARITLKVVIPITLADEIIVNLNSFGAIPAKVVRCDSWSWGVSFLNPQQHRFRLIGWLQLEIGS